LIVGVLGGIDSVYQRSRRLTVTTAQLIMAMPGLMEARAIQTRRDRIEIRRNERIEATRACEGLPPLGYRVSSGYARRARSGRSR
jgi:hypothetical protein